MRQLELFSFDSLDDNANKSEDRGGGYSQKVSNPIYMPSNHRPTIYECYDPQKYYRMVRRIENSNVSDEEKIFLKLAAARHIVFNFEKIADYYAGASVEMQELMEKSALVIIDFEKAIEDGFVELNDKLRRLYEQELDKA